jgi:hypothetical protein
METITKSSTLATTVVSNDTQAAPSVASPTVVKAAAMKLVEMESNRKQWETTAYRTSNQQLYAVLADCLAYGGELPTEQAKERSTVLTDFFTARGYVVKKDSPLMSRIVKAVFGNVDRRRISTYSLVLREAQRQRILPTSLAEWIEERGGIQEIKLSRSATFVSPKAKAETAKQSLSALPNLALVKTDELTLLADGDFVGEECVLLAEQQADGSFAIKALTRSGSAVSAALTALYSQQKKVAEEQ